VNITRLVVGKEPIECLEAESIPSTKAWGCPNESQKGEVDGSMKASLSFPEGIVAQIECSFTGSLFDLNAPSILVIFPPSFNCSLLAKL